MIQVVKICEDGELQASPLGVRGGFSFACPACPLGKQPGFLHFQSISNAQCLTHTARMRLPLRQLPRHVLRTLIFFHWHSPHIHSFNVLSNNIEVLLRPSNGPNEKGMLSAWGLVDVLPNCITLPCCSGPMISLNPIDHSINLMCAITLSSIKVTCVWNPLNSCGWEGQHFPPQHEHNELRQVP